MQFILDYNKGQRSAHELSASVPRADDKKYKDRTAVLNQYFGENSRPQSLHEPVIELLTNMLRLSLVN